MLPLLGKRQLIERGVKRLGRRGKVAVAHEQVAAHALGLQALVVALGPLCQLLWRLQCVCVSRMQADLLYACRPLDTIHTGPGAGGGLRGLTRGW